MQSNFTGLVGKTVHLVCKVKNLGNRTVINFDSPRGGISLVTEKGPETTSRLMIQKAVMTDSGIYTCEPSNANPSRIKVHVVDEERPAAMHHGDGSSSYAETLPMCFVILIVANVIFV
ncbi:uncharacterized protein LOC100864468 [Apis florea]|uniref:uncharacterized protein LOC100864468 n=1 Tax=Apis florea TaxID=7463 RepID=UPI0012FEDA2D|nr:uncharacterized protein LOC100864468 [Apis florea]